MALSRILACAIGRSEIHLHVQDWGILCQSKVLKHLYSRCSLALSISSPTGNRTKNVSWNRIGSSSHQVLWEPRPDPRWTTGSVTVQVKIQDLKQGSWNRGQVLQISAQNWLTWATHKPIMTVLGWEFHYTHCCLVLHANLSCKFLCMVCFRADRPILLSCVQPTSQSSQLPSLPHEIGCIQVWSWHWWTNHPIFNNYRYTESKAKQSGSDS